MWIASSRPRKTQHERSQLCGRIAPWSRNSGDIAKPSANPEKQRFEAKACRATQPRHFSLFLCLKWASAMPAWSRLMRSRPARQASRINPTLPLHVCTWRADNQRGLRCARIQPSVHAPVKLQCVCLVRSVKLACLILRESAKQLGTSFIALFVSTNEGRSQTFAAIILPNFPCIFLGCAVSNKIS